jgi:hypothetical protein
MENFDYVMRHNVRPFKMNDHNGWPRSMFEKNEFSSKIPHSATWWILVSPSGTITNHCNLLACIFSTFKIIALKLP